VSEFSNDKKLLYNSLGHLYLPKPNTPTTSVIQLCATNKNS